MATQTSPEVYATPWQAQSWRDRRLPPSQPRWVLTCSDGALVPLVTQMPRMDANGNLVEPRFFEVDTSLCPDVLVTARYFNQVPAGMWPSPNCPTTVSPQPNSNILPPNASRYLAEHDKGFEASYAMEAGHRAIEAQARIDAIVAANGLQNSTSKMQEVQNKTTSVLEAVAASDPAAATRYKYRPSVLGDDVDPNRKVYCTYWIRWGECDYMQQGCRYKHEMPDLATLKKIGFLNTPRWYRERMSYDAARCQVRARQDVLRKILEAPSDSSTSGDDSDVDSAVSCKPVVSRNENGAIASLANQPISTLVENAKLSDRIIKAVDSTYVPGGVSDFASHVGKPGDLLMDTDEDTSGIIEPLKVPHNTPELMAFRKGRFVPSSEAASTHNPLSTQSIVRSPSPLDLGLSAYEDSAQPAAVQQTARPSPNYIKYFKHQEEAQEQVPGIATVAELESSGKTKEQAMADEIAHLKAQLSVQNRPSSVEPQSQASNSAVRDRVQTGLMGSKHAMTDMNAKVKEKTSHRTKESPRASTSDKGKNKTMTRTRKAMSQVTQREFKKDGAGPVDADKAKA